MSVCGACSCKPSRLLCKLIYIYRMRLLPPPSAIVCLKCNKPYYLYDAVCVGNCTKAALDKGDPGFYYENETLSECKLCHGWCNKCTGPSNTQCSSCVSGKYLAEGVYTCTDDCLSLGLLNDVSTSTCKSCRTPCKTCK